MKRPIYLDVKDLVGHDKDGRPVFRESRFLAGVVETWIDAAGVAHVGEMSPP